MGMRFFEQPEVVEVVTLTAKRHGIPLEDVWSMVHDIREHFDNVSTDEMIEALRNSDFHKKSH
jgi:hypothetical protein